MTADTIAAVVSAFVATASLVVGIFYFWERKRDAALRSGDVLVWANEVICELNTILLICILKEPELAGATAKRRLTDAIFNTAQLVERGRLFFKNTIVDDFGREKEPAFQGYRPVILDHIIAAHRLALRIAREWGEGNEDRRLRMHAVAEDCLKKFVSLAQKEVGRDVVASVDAGKGGASMHLDDLLNAVDEQRLDRLRRAVSCHDPIDKASSQGRAAPRS